MGREASAALEQTALSFLSAIDTESHLDAALFLRRTGLVLASWTREGIRPDVVSVMAATMLASVDTIIEAVGGPASKEVSVETARHRIVATKVDSRSFLVVVAPKTVSRRAIRETVRKIMGHLASASKLDRRPIEETARHRVNVRPPR